MLSPSPVLEGEGGRKIDLSLNNGREFSEQKFKF
jgi:hypothetical protein